MVQEHLEMADRVSPIRRPSQEKRFATRSWIAMIHIGAELQRTSNNTSHLFSALTSAVTQHSSTRRVLELDIANSHQREDDADL
jgi:hypothetical protein